MCVRERDRKRFIVFGQESGSVCNCPFFRCYEIRTPLNTRHTQTPTQISSRQPFSLNAREFPECTKFAAPYFSDTTLLSTCDFRRMRATPEYLSQTAGEIKSPTPEPLTLNLTPCCPGRLLHVGCAPVVVRFLGRRLHGHHRGPNSETSTSNLNPQPSALNL